MALNGKSINKCNEEFIKNYDENSSKGYILEVDGEYLRELHNLHSDLPFLPERTKINKLINVVNLFALFMINTTILFI